MKFVRDIGEVGLIARLSRRLPRSTDVAVGVGDDAAVLGPPSRARLLFACDMLVEGTHFLLAPPSSSRGKRWAGRGRIPARWIGWKALAVNVSDIAAMGGVPRWAVVSLGLPPATPLRFADELYAGLSRCAQRFGVSIVGGDTVRASRIVIDVAILGTVAAGRAILRSGAAPGDVLFVTGRLGGSSESGRHARFVPRLAESHALLRRVRVRAMMDLSDGLASDLWQMSRASGVRLRVEASRVPVAGAARRCRRRGCRCRVARNLGPVYHALMDGEDFELLFAVRPRDVARVPRRLRGCLVTPIGRAVSRGVGVELVHPDGRVRPLLPTGFKHF